MENCKGDPSGKTNFQTLNQAGGNGTQFMSSQDQGSHHCDVSREKELVELVLPTCKAQYKCEKVFGTKFSVTKIMLHFRVMLFPCKRR